MAMARTPGTPASKIERMPVCTPGGSHVKEEKIFVTVRIRPPNDAKDEAVWECTNSQTIQYRRDSSVCYTFDRVFGPTTLNETVYEEGAKLTALSALTGINATIFAYGQTGSGKTFTMRGVTESAVSDIYNHIRNTPEREFIIKMSAMEIYNENVKDLLMPDSGPLRLLDDPEKGTIVEKLEELTAKDSQHLRELISKCEAQRQVGETGSNKRSSRSHQIIRLTVESRLRDSSGCVKSFVAVLNFVDLAGSERVAQTHAKGKTLEEGCHINKSLLTLTTVIRKLSENKSAHIPYRDSKLTRILQLSLGGNARTAIICTMSPSKSNMELSRNTLFFAMSAKKVTNNAQVNMVISNKQLVKHLQKEVARLEAVLRTPESTKSDAILMEKDMRIKQMEEEMEELKKERDLAKSQLDDLRKKMGGSENQQGWNAFNSSPHRIAKRLTFSFSGPSRQYTNPLRQSSTAPVMLVQEIRKLEHLQQQLGDEANHALEVLQKEVACHRLGNQDAAETIAKLQAEIREMRTAKPSAENKEMPSSEAGLGCQTNLKEEITRLHSQGNTIANLEAQLENVQRSIDKLVMSLPNIAGQMGHCGGTGMEKMSVTNKSQSGKKKKLLPLALSGNMNRSHLLRTPCSPLSSSRNAVVSPTDETDENCAPQLESELNTNMSTTNTNTPTKSESTPTKSESNATTPAMSGGDASSREGTPNSGYRRSSSVNMKKMQKMFQNAAEENVRSIRAYVTELKGRVAKLQYQKQLLVCQVLELEANEAAKGDQIETEDTSAVQCSPNSWRNTFREQMQQIFMLWDECYVSIIHRTQFYLLFQGDRADQIYIEVEIRRLMWLHQHFMEVGNASPAQICGDEPSISISSSIRELKNEREFLAKRMNSRLNDEERERLYLKWDVPLDGKQRKLQLINKLWTDPTDRLHIDESADIVARLVGFHERDGNVAKEMFELNFALPSSKKPWLLGWQPISNLLRL